MQHLTLSLTRPLVSSETTDDFPLHDGVSLFGHPTHAGELADALVASAATPADTGTGTGTDVAYPAAIAGSSGHWAGVVEGPDRVTLFADHLRSYPLFYCVLPSGVIVTDDIAEARRLSGLNAREAKAAAEFLSLGFVTGAQTLFTGIRQVQAGERITIHADGRVESAFTRRTKYTGRDITDDEPANERFTTAFDRALDAMFSWVGDRQVVVPLSGGLDSRLTLIALRDRGVENVLAFTYGVADSREATISREVAERLGYRWEFVEYDPEGLRTAWAGKDAGDFVRASYAGASLPHVQDWFAVRELQRRGVLASDAVFAPGHCIVGNGHDDEIIDAPGTVSREQMLDLILGHHASMRAGGRQALVRDSDFSAKVYAYFDRVGFDGSPLARWQTLEDWNLLERQTKYINNSVRTYEHFGYDWAMPMLDRELFEAWEDFALNITRDRDWYHRYVFNRYEATTGERIGTFTATNVSASKRDAVKRVLASLGLLDAVTRRITLRAVEHHPMSFQAFLGAATPRQLRREILRGGTQMGLYTEQFLADTWSPTAHIFDSH
ncbi:asparagine synthase-related protein [Leucobacter salsicius]|uniref:asparagine synthase-related protein n=1 Tax=Leucobacter salsicius TaxID=664638 RepID=UPI000349DAC5|nr:asparagine synthase-related protein [Leucobacter salsicius]